MEFFGRKLPKNRCNNLVKTVNPGVSLKPRLTRRVGAGVEQQANWGLDASLVIQPGGGAEGKTQHHPGHRLRRAGPRLELDVTHTCFFYLFIFFC